MEVFSPLSIVKSSLINISDSLPLSDMQKTVLLVAAVALCCLAACYAVYLLVRRFINGKPLESDSAKVTTALSEVLVVDPKPAVPDSSKEPSDSAPSKVEEGSDEEFHEPKPPTPSEFYALVASLATGDTRVAKPDEKALQSLLHAIEEHSITDPSFFLRQLFQQLFALKSFSPLPKNDIKRLDAVLCDLEKGYGNDKFSVFSNITPGVIASLVRNSLLVGRTDCIRPILVAGNRKLLSKEQVQQFAEGFNLGTSKEMKLQIPVHELSELFEFLIEAENVTLLKSHLSDAQIKQFIGALIGLIVMSVNADKMDACQDLYRDTLQHAGAFGEEHRAVVLEVLQQVRSPGMLASILSKAKPDMLATMLKMHPPEATDPEDTFFQQLVSHLWPLSNVVEHVFKNESDKRKEILLAELKTDVIFNSLELIPISVLKGRAASDKDFLKNLLPFVCKTPDESKLKVLASLLTPDQLRDLIGKYEEMNEWIAPMLPLCDHKFQVQFVSSIFAKDVEFGNGMRCLAKAKLKPDVWEEASRQQLLQEVPYVFDHDPERRALILNGQIAHPAGLKGHLQSLYLAFGGDLEVQVACTARLKPALFKSLAVPDDFDFYYFPWARIFEVLRQLPDQTMAHGIFIDSALAFLNAKRKIPENLYAMTKEQMMLLPLAEIKVPENRLLVACLTNRLDDTMIETAKGLENIDYGQATYRFCTYLKKAVLNDKVTDSDPAFKPDIQYLIRFLRWVLDRKSVEKEICKWIKGYMHDLLERPEIKGDPEIHALIAKAPYV